MKKLFAVCTFSFLVMAAALVAANESPRVSRTALAPMEKSLDNRLLRLWDDNALGLLGSTRGIYLEGYGAVFTVEFSLSPGPISLMHTRFSPEDKERLHARKAERLPLLVKAMRMAAMETAASLDTVPPEEQIVIAVFFPRYPDEDTRGLPSQITFQGQKKKLIEAKRANGAGLENAIRVTEY
jgi:hypothetical protein